MITDDELLSMLNDLLYPKYIGKLFGIKIWGYEKDSIGLESLVITVEYGQLTYINLHELISDIDVYLKMIGIQRWRLRTWVSC